MFSRKGLNVCASCHQVVGTADKNIHLKHSNTQNDTLKDKMKGANENRISPNSKNENIYN